MRLHELAKTIGAESKALLAMANELGLKVRNHSSNLAVGEVAILKAAYREEFGDTTPEDPDADPEKPKATKSKKKRVRRKKSSSTPPEASEESVDSAVLEEFDESLGSDQPVSDDTASEIVSDADAPEGEQLGVSEDELAADDISETAEERPSNVSIDSDDDSQGDDDSTDATDSKPTVTKRKRAPGAKIVGRIELPTPPSVERRGSGSRAKPGPGPAVKSAETIDPATLEEKKRTTRSAAGQKATEDKAKQANARKQTDSGLWNPDDEDDPLLRGIRVRNLQAGPHSRRPPRRVGPRRTVRRPAPVLNTGPVDIQVPILIRDLSRAMGIKANGILRILVGKGVMAHVNMALDEEGVLEVAAELNRDVNITSAVGKEEAFLGEVDARKQELVEQSEAKGGENLKARPPIVTFLGHVDHGKTSLLDRIRKTNVTEGEAGGITQSMSAYGVSLPDGHRITFLDTPGHKAFTEMRARGANVTDIAVLVVAADDGVMPQTEEAIQHAQAAGVPIVVALNKIDRPESNPDRVLQQLSHASVMVEGWGGEVQVAKVSAITGEGIEDLLEKISLQAELMDLRADPGRSATGTVLESRKDDALGPIATVLVSDGTLKTGDVLLSGVSYGRVRMLVNDLGKNVDSAGPSEPVNVIGLDQCPGASEAFYVMDDLKKARAVADERVDKERHARVAGPSPAGTITLENLFENLEAGKAEELKLVLRCDVQGSLEVLRRSLAELEKEEVKIKIIREALGGITEDDVLLALASEGVVVGFNVIADEKARGAAEFKGVEIRTYEIIYELIDDMKKAMEGMLAPLRKENVIGHVEVRQVFKASKLGNIAGCRVQDGVVRRNAAVRLTREGRVLYTGKLDSLKRFKEDVREVKEGLECGLRIAGYDDIKVDDVIEVIEYTEERRTLDFESA